MTRTPALPLTIAMACALCLGSCSPQDDPAPSPSAPTSTIPATSGPATTVPSDVVETTTAEPELSPEEQDEADIEETLVLYTRALDDAFNGDESVEAIYPFSRDAAREKWVTQVMADQARGLTSTGLTDLEVLEVNVADDSAEVTACADVTDVDVMDENGDSIVPDTRLDRTLMNLVLERDDAAQVGWYVVEDKNLNEPCDG